MQLYSANDMQACIPYYFGYVVECIFVIIIEKIRIRNLLT